MNHAFAYLRTSLDPSDSAASKQLAHQLRRIRTYAATRGYRVIATFADCCAAAAEHRPGLDALIGAVERSLAVTVIAVNETRLGRDQLQLKEIVHRLAACDADQLFLDDHHA